MAVQKFKFKANRPKIMGNTNITPYWRVLEKIIDASDIVLEVIDARMPELSRNIELENLINKKGKDLVIILNKSDLVSEKELRKKFRKYNKIKPTFIISSTKKIGTKRLREYITKKSLESEHFKIGVVGYPNTGKSSIINSLARRKKAAVTSKAGTTKGQQWISAGKLDIIDSPGIIPLKQDDEIRLALIGSKNVEKIKNLDLVAHTIINLFEDKTKLNKFYDITIKSDDPDEIINEIGKRKGYVKKGGEVDEKRASIQIIRDWQRGKLKL